MMTFLVQTNFLKLLNVSETEENSKQQRLDQSRRANFKIPTALKNKVSKQIS